MTRTAYGLIAVALFATTSAIAQTPSWTPPPDSARCPSKWGAGDERGSGNHMKPQSVLNAAKLAAMAAAARGQGILDAADRLADLVVKVAGIKAHSPA